MGLSGSDSSTPALFDPTFDQNGVLPTDSGSNIYFLEVVASAVVPQIAGSVEVGSMSSDLHFDLTLELIPISVVPTPGAFVVGIPLLAGCWAGNAVRRRRTYQ